MSTAGISFGGLASGLDTRAIISALVAVERRPIAQLEAKKTSLNKQKSLFGDLGGLLDKLHAASKALKATTDFLQMKAASDDETLLTATAGGSATPGTHTINVVSLATAQVHSSSGSAAADASFGGPASLQIDIGGNTHILSINSPTLQSIADAINGEGIGVRADVVDTGNTQNGGANRYQLVVRATETGAQNGFTLTYDDGDAAFQGLVADISANVRTAAQDAHIQLSGGIDIYRSTNQITNVIGGVTLDLRGANPGKAVTVTVSTDAEETSKKLQEFVDAYNGVVDFFQKQNGVDAEGKASSPLFGDSMLRSVRSNLRGVVGGLVSGTGNDSYQLLSQLGITSDREGKLTLNTSKFEEALADDEQAVAAVFTNAAAGIATRIMTQIDVYTDSVDGLIKTRTDSFDRQVRDTQNRIDQSERRLDLYEQQLEAKYANLESLLARLQGQGNSLSSFNTARSS
jgi:flagellar hook-associated protein 2